MPGKLANPRHERFCQEYVIDCNGTLAYIRAGYSERGASNSVLRVLALASVKNRIAELQQRVATKLEITAERVLREIAVMGFATMKNYMRTSENGGAYVDLSNLTDDQWAAIQEFTVDQTGGGAGDGERRAVERVRFKLSDKTKNLELLARHLKLLTDKLEVTGDETILAALAAGRQRAAQR